MVQSRPVATVATISDRDNATAKDANARKATAPRLGRLSVGLQGDRTGGEGWGDRTGIACLGCSSHRKKVDCHRIAIFNIVEPAVLATRK